MRCLTAALEAALLVVALGSSGCDRDSGPAEVKLGRDVCEMCGMIISDPRFIAEVRLADGKLHKFDDAGDAVNWLSQACVAPAEAKEFWTMDSGNGKAWLDARKAFWRPAETPMSYNFGAVQPGTPGAIPFEAMRPKVLRPQYACKSGVQPKAGP